MAQADLILYLEGSLEVGAWRQLAGALAAQRGILAAGQVARKGGRLLHLRYDPTAVTASMVAEQARALGHPGRIAAL